MLSQNLVIGSNEVPDEVFELIECQDYSRNQVISLIKEYLTKYPDDRFELLRLIVDAMDDEAIDTYQN